MTTSMPPADAPVLIFDSGVGGLSILKAVKQQLPGMPMVYAMDGAAYPYGSCSDRELATRVPALLGRLVERYRPRLVVIACNTASTIALADVRRALAVPVVGTVPAVKPAAELTRSGTIGILGTRATIRQRYVDELVQRYARHCRVLRYGAPGLVNFAESNLRGLSVDGSGAPGKAMTGLRNQLGGHRLDTVVLACTHFPLALEALRAVAPAGMTFIDGAAGIARRCATLLTGQSWAISGTPDTALTTGDVQACAALAPGFRALGLAPVIGF